MPLTGRTGHTWSAFPAWRKALPRKRPPRRRRMKFWWPCIRGFRPHSIPPCSNPWHKFRMATPRYKVSVWDRQWPIESWPCEATTARMPSRFLMFSGRLPEITNRHLRIFRRSPNSRIGLAWPRSRWSVRASSGPALPRRWPAIRTVMLSIKSLGIVNSTTATADEALTGRFWNGAIQNYWNEISQTFSQAHGLTTAQSARLFAVLNLSFADDVIAFYDAKYTYNFWRPVTAIRAADTGINAETVADPNWLPEVGKTAPDPSYPGAHAVISASGAEVLISFFERDHAEFNVTSEVLPGVERSFTSISAAAEEATLSRTFGGQHFRFDLTTGQRLGRDVADFVLDNFLTPAHGKDESDDK